MNAKEYSPEANVVTTTFEIPKGMSPSQIYFEKLSHVVSMFLLQNPQVCEQIKKTDVVDATSNLHVHPKVKRVQKTRERIREMALATANLKSLADDGEDLSWLDNIPSSRQNRKDIDDFFGER